MAMTGKGGIHGRPTSLLVHNPIIEEVVVWLWETEFSQFWVVFWKSFMLKIFWNSHQSMTETLVKKWLADWQVFNSSSLGLLGLVYLCHVLDKGFLAAD